MARQLQKKFIGNDQVDSTKILLEQGQAIRAKDSAGVEQELIKFDGSDKILVNGDEVAVKAQVDAEQAAREAADSALDARLDIVEGGDTVVGSIAKAQKDAQDYADMKVAALVDSAPALLDTLNELAAAIGDDPNFVTTVVNSVATVQSNLDAEITNRIADVDAEEVRALAAEGNLQTQITDNFTSLDNYITGVEDLLTQEIADRQAADALKADLAGATFSGDVTVPNLYASGSANIGYFGGEFNSVSAKTIQSSDAADLQINSTSSKVTISAGNDYGRNSAPGTVAKDIMLNPTSGQIDATFSRVKNVASATDFNDAVIKGQLDSVESSLQGQIDALSSGAVAAVQSELDATQVGAGLGTDGSYSAPVGSNYLGSAVSLKDADSKLDAQIKVVADGLAQEIIDRAADVDAEQSRAEGAEAALQSDINAVAADLAQEILDRQADVDAEESRAMGVEASLQSQITQEISDRQADVDAEESRAIAAEGVLQSNIDAEESARIAADSALDARVDVLESVVWFKQKFSISNGQTSVTLSHIPEANSMSAFVDRLAIHEGASEDYTISGTTMTFLNDLVSPGSQQIGNGDTVYVKYQYKA